MAAQSAETGERVCRRIERSAIGSAPRPPMARRGKANENHARRRWHANQAPFRISMRPVGLKPVSNLGEQTGIP